MHETWVWSLGQEDPLEKEMATCFQYFCQGNLMGREAWWTTVHGVAKKLDVTEQLSMHPHLNVGKTQESWVSPPNGCNPVYLFIFSFIFISWRLITLQYCSGFCHPLTWISHGFTCSPHPDAPSHLPLYPLPLGLPSAPGLSICLMHPTWAGDLRNPHFKCHLQLKTKEDVGVMVWSLKGRKAIHTETEKQMFGK